MKAIKCDRCGTFQKNPHKTLAGSVIRGALKAGWYSKSVDLCDKCSKELKNILREYWQKVRVTLNDKHKYQVGDIPHLSGDARKFDDWDAALKHAIERSGCLPITGCVGIWTSQDNEPLLVAIVYRQEVFKR